jgi:hypothetical protein
MHAETVSFADAENWLALGTGALLLIVGASRRSVGGTCLAVSSVPLLYRGITGPRDAIIKVTTTAICGSDLHIYEIDPSFIITHRIGLEDAPSMYRTFRDKHDSCVKVVMNPDASTKHSHPDSTTVPPRVEGLTSITDKETQRWPKRRSTMHSLTNSVTRTTPKNS